MRELKIEQSIPDSLDSDCNMIFDVLDNWISCRDITYKIELLKQCIDYLEMDRASHD